MPTNCLLGLPQELRDLIIEYTITSAGTAPDTLDKDSATKEYDDLKYVSRVGGRGVFYPVKNYNTSPFALLLVNHQFHNETKATLERLGSSSGNKYSMDIILSDEQFLYPAWISVPPLIRSVDCFAVNFRIFGVGGNETNGFMDVDDGSTTGEAVWRLYTVLERFLRCGTTKPRSPSEDRGLRLKQLAINIEKPTNIEEHLIAPDDVNPDALPKYRRENAPHNMAMNPTALARVIYIWVEGILRLSDPSYALLGTAITKYSKMFLDRIADIVINVDGQRKFSIDVAEMRREIAELSSEVSK
jgi:hypothetical protein